MFQIQLANGLEIAVAMHVSVYIYNRLTLPMMKLIMKHVKQ